MSKHRVFDADFSIDWGERTRLPCQGGESVFEHPVRGQARNKDSAWVGF